MKIGHLIYMRFCLLKFINLTEFLTTNLCWTMRNEPEFAEKLQRDYWNRFGAMKMGATAFEGSEEWRSTKSSKAAVCNNFKTALNYHNLSIVASKNTKRLRLLLVPLFKIWWIIKILNMQNWTIKNMLESSVFP